MNRMIIRWNEDGFTDTTVRDLAIVGWKLVSTDRYKMLVRDRTCSPESVSNRNSLKLPEKGYILLVEHPTDYLHQYAWDARFINDNDFDEWRRRDSLFSNSKRDYRVAY